MCRFLASQPSVRASQVGDYTYERSLYSVRLGFPRFCPFLYSNQRPRQAVSCLPSSLVMLQFLSEATPYC